MCQLGGGACEALPFRAQARMLGRNAPERKTIMKVIATPNAPAAIGPYVQGRVCGNLLFASGQIALSPETGQRLSYLAPSLKPRQSVEFCRADMEPPHCSACKAMMFTDTRPPRTENQKGVKLC